MLLVKKDDFMEDLGFQSVEIEVCSWIEAFMNFFNIVV